MEDKQPPSLLSVATFIIALATLMLVIAFALVDDIYQKETRLQLKAVEERCR